MPKVPAYGKKLIKELHLYYTSEDIDNFDWWPDVDNAQYYSLIFKDTNGRKREIRYIKDTNKVALR